MADAPTPAAATPTAATPAATPTAATPAPAAVTPSAAPAAPAAAVAAPATAPAQPSTAAPEPAVAVETPAEPAAPTEAAAAEAEPTSLLGEAEKPAPEPAKPDAPAPDATATASAAPAIVYEFTWPEGVEPLPAEDLAPFTAILGEAKVAPEAGQKLMDLYLSESAKLVERLNKQSETVWNETRREWVDAIRNDPELGGNRFQATITACRQLINQYGGTEEQKAELYQAFNLTGMGDNPAMMRFVHNISKTLLEQARPVTAAKPVLQASTRAQRRYAGSLTNGAA